MYQFTEKHKFLESSTHLHRIYYWTAQARKKSLMGVLPDFCTCVFSCFFTPNLWSSGAMVLNSALRSLFSCSCNLILIGYDRVIHSIIEHVWFLPRTIFIHIHTCTQAKRVLLIYAIICYPSLWSTDANPVACCKLARITKLDSRINFAHLPPQSPCSSAKLEVSSMLP